MGSKAFFGITFAIIALFAVVLYYGISALSPRSYGPISADVGISPAHPEENSRTEAPELPGNPAAALREGLETSSSSPVTSGIARAPQTPGMPTIVSDDEAAAYRATSTPKIAGLGTLPIPAPDADIWSFPPNLVIIAERPSAAVPTSIWAYDAKKKIISALMADVPGAMATLSKNGAFALVGSTAPSGTFALEFIDMKDKSRLPIRFTTLPPKCAVRSDVPVIYCGIPATMPPNAILPDDYLKRALYTNDRIISIDIAKAEVKEIMPRQKDQMDVWLPIISDDSLLFENRRDGKIYRLGL